MNPNIPDKTKFAGQIINGFQIITASDLDITADCVAHARVRGSVGGEDYVYECAPWNVMPEDRKIERWAVVKKISEKTA
jgi:hypothetical protein